MPKFFDWVIYDFRSSVLQVSNYGIKKRDKRLFTSLIPVKANYIERYFPETYFSIRENKS